MPFPSYESDQANPNQDCHATKSTQHRAYELWVQAGKPEGMRSDGKSWADYFWALAESEVKACFAVTPADSSAASNSSSQPAKSPKK